MASKSKQHKKKLSEGFATFVKVNTNEIQRILGCLVENTFNLRIRSKQWKFTHRYRIISFIFTIARIFTKNTICIQTRRPASARMACCRTQLSDTSTWTSVSSPLLQTHSSLHEHVVMLSTYANSAARSYSLSSTLSKVLNTLS